MNYYNEHDPKLAPWLYELMAAGAIAPGYVDTRSIEDVTPNDLRGFKQCHFFAGIGGWSYALRLAGWPDDRAVWTGSCPCQPFSAAGKGAGFDDQRHLWPAWQWLISQCRPGVVFGEQVASKDGLAWLDLVLTDLEVEGYAVGAFDLCAAGVGAPHIRQRLWFVADANGGYARTEGLQRSGQHGLVTQDGGAGRGLADNGREGRRQVGTDVAGSGSGSGTQGLDERPLHGGTVVMGDAERQSRALGVGDGRVPGGPGRDDARQAAERAGVHAGALDDADGAPAVDAVQTGRDVHRGAGPWRDADWVLCRDGKARPVEPGTFPLAHGVPGRVGQLRAYGNAIVPQVAQTVIEAYLETHDQTTRR